MTLLLVVAMVAVLVTAHLWLNARRKHAADRARNAVRFVEIGPASQPGDDVLFHPGHTWVQMHHDGLASIGVSAFAANFAGNVALVETADEGSKLHQAERAWTLVSTKGRRLDLPMPIDGEILAVNDEVRRDPKLLQRRPYDKGWILRVRPRHVADAARNLLPASAAQSWIDSTRAAITARLSAVPGAVAYDGGEWSPAFGDKLDDRDWNALRRDLFPAAAAGEKRPSHDVSTN